MPGRRYLSSGADAEHGYSGDYSRENDALQWNEFQYRNYDSRLGRWLSPDPARQYASPFIGMGNNPISVYDPTGLWGYVNEKTGEFMWVNYETSDFFETDDGTIWSLVATSVQEMEDVTAANGQYGFMVTDFAGSRDADGNYIPSSGGIIIEAAVSGDRLAYARDFIENHSYGQGVYIPSNKNNIAYGSIINGNFGPKEMINYSIGATGLISSGFLASAERERRFLQSKNTKTAATKLRKIVNPSIEKYSKFNRGLGMAGVALQGTMLFVDLFAGDGISYSEAFDFGVTVALAAVTISNPYLIVGFAVYSWLDTQGAFDGVKQQLGGDNTLVEPIKMGSDPGFPTFQF